VTCRGAARTSAIAGFLAAGAAVLLIGFLAGPPGSSDPSRLPPLRILDPATGDLVHNPVTVRFSTPAGLRLTPSGWTAADLHLHLMIDDRELMPAAADIAAADTTFSWRLPLLPPGTYRVYLTWAGRHHGNLRGDTDTVMLRVGR
jgi:hypothetical protein